MDSLSNSSGLSDATISNYKGPVREFLNSLPIVAIKDLKQEHVSNFVLKDQAKKSFQTQRIRRAAISWLVKDVLKRTDLKANPQKIRVFKEEGKKPHKYYKPEKIREILRVRDPNSLL